MKLDAKLLRAAGIVVGSAAMTISLVVAALNGHPAPVTDEAPVVARPLPPATPAEPQPVFEPAAGGEETGGQAGEGNVSFLVRFRGEGPIARAQAQAARGDQAGARRTIEQALARQSAFRGLCFDRFTVGAAEIVLRACAPVPATERERLTARWLARLRRLASVEYADINANAAPSRTP